MLFVIGILFKRVSIIFYKLSYVPKLARAYLRACVRMSVHALTNKRNYVWSTIFAIYFIGRESKRDAWKSQQ